MTDYKRMEREFYAHEIATWARVIAIIAVTDEVAWALKYHFPWWDDIAMPLTLFIHQTAAFVQRHTRLYWDALRG